ncbi:hypothetical protein LTR86_006551 [Recurvomyces mirabilis]|nr:hypothetical protein LTR86_006551 [Recurvomyces mirabilis]
MAVPFGVSVGDFISGIQFIYSIIEAADATTGSVAQYHGVLAALQSSQDALQHLQTLRLAALDQQAVVAILGRYRQSITAFGLAISDYDEAFTSGHAKKWWRCLPKKVKWQRASAQRIQIFRSELNEHGQSLLLVLHGAEAGARSASHTGTVDHLENIKRKVDDISGLHLTHQAIIGQRMDEHRILLDAIRANAGSQMLRQDQSIRDTLATASRNEDHHRQLRAAVTLISISLVCIIGMMVRMLRSIPQKVWLSAVNFEDAHGFRFRVCTQFIVSWDAFLHVIVDRFKQQKLPGQLRVARRMFRLHYQANGQEISMQIPFATAFRPGKHILMSMVFDQDKMHSRCCPDGLEMRSGIATRRCTSCGFECRFLDSKKSDVPESLSKSVDRLERRISPQSSTYGPSKASMNVDYQVLQEEKPSDFSRVSIQPDVPKVSRVRTSSRRRESMHIDEDARVADMQQRLFQRKGDINIWTERLLEFEHQYQDGLAELRLPCYERDGPALTADQFQSRNEARRADISKHIASAEREAQNLKQQLMAAGYDVAESEQGSLSALTVDGSGSSVSEGISAYAVPGLHVMDKITKDVNEWISTSVSGGYMDVR